MAGPEMYSNSWHQNAVRIVMRVILWPLNFPEYPRGYEVKSRHWSG